MGGGHTVPSAACALTVLVASGTLIQKLLQEGQEEATGPGKLEAAPREPRATRHPGPGQNTRSDPHLGGAGDPTVTASPTRHTGQTRSHSTLLLDTSPKTQVSGREEALEASCVGGATAAPQDRSPETAPPQHRLPGHHRQAALRPAKQRHGQKPHRPEVENCFLLSSPGKMRQPSPDGVPQNDRVPQEKGF